MSTTRTRNGIAVTVGNMAGNQDSVGGWVIEAIWVSSDPVEHDSQMWRSEEEAFLRGFSIGNTARDKLMPRQKL